MNKHFLIVLNPLYNKQKKYWLGWVINQLKSHYIRYYIYTTSKVLADNQHFFKKHLSDYDEVVVLGGDGTLHLVANCMPYAKQPITVLPCGTGNDFARNFAYSHQQLKQLLLSERTMDIDLGKINQRYFINSAGVGFDAQIVEKTTSNKGWLARFSYLFYATKCLLTYREVPLELEYANKQENYLNFLCVFANGKFFGGGMKIAPAASLNSNQLLRYSVKNTHIFKKLWAMTKIYSGKHITLKEVSCSPFKKLKIKTSNLPIQADGELAGMTPATVEIVPHALKIKII